MKESICGANCAECPYENGCLGCSNTNGCPSGKLCFVAKYILDGGMDAYLELKRGIIDEVNALGILGDGKLTELYPLVGSFVNLEYPLPNGEAVKFLRDDEMYLGAQIEMPPKDGVAVCRGIIARENFLLICEYGENCSDPKIVLYKMR